jgi:hypothetical protein
VDQGEAVLHGHHEVADKDARGIEIQGSKRFADRVRERDLQPRLCQKSPQCFAAFWVIVDDENARAQ